MTASLQQVVISSENTVQELKQEIMRIWTALSPSSGRSALLECTSYLKMYVAHFILLKYNLIAHL